ncbi:MAG: hypothetical protein Q8N10_03330 [Phenylobacterium sp.]|uniref:hypothetical protein n=1 Tax=Phenylobacterium sp. TaxID=1871053 RepID=UPI002725D6E9|nr:hypothetical protein [Phenylobacterium sp.]MDO8912302.1 hypothetical protein [Phenylobacterium sp.]MDP3099514.1 hypothetical protein [Phenylobacterium sp.]
MSEDWAAAARDIDAGMREAGQLVALLQPATNGTFDTASDTTSGASPPQTHHAYGVQGEAYSAFSISSGVVAAGDVRFMLSTLTEAGAALPTPEADAWTVTLNGKTHTVKAVDTTQPADVPLLYELRLRR